ncbi:hypothetical protein ALQ36_103558 [Pseudomonas syringae pv. primulae]|uniref:Uncharacterized protein n=1 Tax=Pseudomonas syringae pv. primulae TaxID=251707 RepID=A0A3M5TDU4_9PSED|nr:hypothetical protein ALQ36_103558 [Pseudomonas syringae pv. primulae]RMR10314.1 hypothetical protein ALP92_103719 [Pseudomonas syringae pv. primulae]RMU31753.1 hypothetical protein ALP30_104094 [Pseudomonas syringae pv. primulae]
MAKKSPAPETASGFFGFKHVEYGVFGLVYFRAAAVIAGLNANCSRTLLN